MLDRLDPIARESDAFGVHAARVRALEEKCPTDEEVRLARGKFLRGLDLPLDVLVPRASLRNDSRVRRCHVWGGPIPTGAFARVGAGVYVAAPEFVFVQFARVLTVPQLVRLGFEQCGGYATSLCGTSAASRCLPATTSSAIARFAGRIDGAPGVGKARRAARCVADRSGSPMETVLVCLLCLPRTMGGYGLPFPAMNKRIDVPAGQRAMLGRSWLACDAYWPERNYAIEYDGRLYHRGAANVARDYVRSNSLALLGISTTLCTARDIFDETRFDHLAHQVARGLGVRLRKRDLGPAWRVRCSALRASLLDGACKGP